VTEPKVSEPTDGAIEKLPVPETAGEAGVRTMLPGAGRSVSESLAVETLNVSAPTPGVTLTLAVSDAVGVAAVRVRVPAAGCSTIERTGEVTLSVSDADAGETLTFAVFDAVGVAAVSERLAAAGCSVTVSAAVSEPSVNDPAAGVTRTLAVVETIGDAAVNVRLAAVDLTVDINREFAPEVVRVELPGCCVLIARGVSDDSVRAVEAGLAVAVFWRAGLNATSESAAAGGLTVDRSCAFTPERSSAPLVPGCSTAVSLGAIPVREMACVAG
jgi:hypothetical protein